VIPFFVRLQLRVARTVLTIICTALLCLGVAYSGSAAKTSKTNPSKTKSTKKASGKSSPSGKSAASKSSSAKKSSGKKGSTAAKGTSKKSVAGKRGVTAKAVPRGQQSPSTDRITEIQKALIERGYGKGEPTGTWGPDSAEALRKFQEDNKINPTGKLNSMSLIHLGLGPKRDTIAQRKTEGQKP